MKLGIAPLKMSGSTTLTVGSKGIVGVQVSAFTTFPAMIALYTGSCSKLTLIGCYGGTFGTGLIQWFTY